MAYTDLTTTFESKLRLDWQEHDELAENDNYDKIEAGTVMLWFQAAAPTGWTKATTQNDKIMRVVSGAGGGSGGSLALSSGITLAHSHTVDAHTHSAVAHAHALEKSGSAYGYDSDGVVSGGSDGDLMYVSASVAAGTGRQIKGENTSTDGATNTGSDNPGMNSQLTSITLAYLNVIQCSKDSGTFNDLSAEYDYKDLLTYQTLEDLSENDHFNLIESSNVTFFFQAAAPTMWTKATANNDKALRIVSGAGGGTAGSAGLSSAITLAHSHTVTSHNHSFENHLHALGYLANWDDSGTLLEVMSSDSDGTVMFEWSSGGSTLRHMKNATKTDGGGANTGDATPGMDSQLTNVTFAYINVIACTKDVGSYTDLRTEFDYMDLITWINIDALSENDAYNHFGSGTVACFFQAAAPTGWTKSAVNDDKALRVVSGAGGGTGGSKGVSTEITLAHTHTITSHTHTFPTHQHIIDYTLPSARASLTSGRRINHSGATGRMTPQGATGGEFSTENRTASDSSGTTDAKTPGTDSQLTSTTLAYINAIVCSKDA